MIRNIKRLLGLDNVEYVDNTNKEYNWLEGNKYLLVESSELPIMLFTESQIKIAQKRAQKNKEDIQ